ncbi:MAG: methionine--tRNA ligase subunit beta [Candidatus Cloacimonadaceae bacterium]
MKQTLWVCAALLQRISVALSPILPKHMKALRQMMSLPDLLKWDDAYAQRDFRLSEFKPLLKKIEDEAIQEQLDKLHAKANDKPQKTYEPVKEQITFEEFSALDLRLARILEAKPVPKTDKLLHLKVDLGFEQRELVAGIAQSYKAEELIGKTVTMLVNLQPRKIRGVVSNGMILAAHDEDGLHVVLSDGGSPGSPVQ